MPIDKKVLMDRMKGHFQEKLEDKLLIVEVPEWGDDDGPLRIHVKPLNMREKMAISARGRKGEMEGILETLIVSARDEEGNRIFSTGQRNELMNSVDGDLLIRTVARMNGFDPAQVLAEAAAELDEGPEADEAPEDDAKN